MIWNCTGIKVSWYTVLLISSLFLFSFDVLLLFLLFHFLPVYLVVVFFCILCYHKRTQHTSSLHIIDESIFIQFRTFEHQKCVWPVKEMRWPNDMNFYVMCGCCCRCRFLLLPLIQIATKQYKTSHFPSISHFFSCVCVFVVCARAILLCFSSILHVVRCNYSDTLSTTKQHSAIDSVCTQYMQSIYRVAYGPSL